MTEALFSLLVGAVAVQRVVELRQSRRNEAIIRARGGREHAAQQMPWMVALHASWFAAMLLEVFALDRPLSLPLAGVALAVFAAGQWLRSSARRNLGWRWSVRVMAIPGAPLVESGPYRRMRHPNYLGVALEVASLPLVHGAWSTALLYSALNALMLRRRIRAEELALGIAR